jgi:hypothetical protein
VIPLSALFQVTETFGYAKVNERKLSIILISGGMAEWKKLCTVLIAQYWLVPRTDSKMCL